jgi:hypothetical protein
MGPCHCTTPTTEKAGQRVLAATSQCHIPHQPVPTATAAAGCCSYWWQQCHSLRPGVGTAHPHTCWHPLPGTGAVRLHAPRRGSPIPTALGVSCAPARAPARARVPLPWAWPWYASAWKGAATRGCRGCGGCPSCPVFPGPTATPLSAVCLALLAVLPGHSPHNCRGSLALHAASTTFVQSCGAGAASVTHDPSATDTKAAPRNANVAASAQLAVNTKGRAPAGGAVGIIGVGCVCGAAWLPHSGNSGSSRGKDRCIIRRNRSTSSSSHVYGRPTGHIGNRGGGSA